MPDKKIKQLAVPIIALVAGILIGVFAVNNGFLGEGLGGTVVMTTYDSETNCFDRVKYAELTTCLAGCDEIVSPSDPFALPGETVYNVPLVGQTLGGDGGGGVSWNDEFDSVYNSVNPVYSLVFHNLGIPVRNSVTSLTDFTKSTGDNIQVYFMGRHYDVQSVTGAGNPATVDNIVLVLKEVATSNMLTLKNDAEFPYNPNNNDPADDIYRAKFEIHSPMNGKFPTFYAINKIYIYKIAEPEKYINLECTKNCIVKHRCSYVPAEEIVG